MMTKCRFRGHQTRFIFSDHILSHSGGKKKKVNTGTNLAVYTYVNALRYIKDKGRYSEILTLEAQVQWKKELVGAAVLHLFPMRMRYFNSREILQYFPQLTELSN